MRISNITRPVWSIALTAAVAVVLAAALATPADTTTTDALNRCNAGFPSDSSMSFPKDGQDSRWTPVETSTLRSGNVVRIALHRVYFGGRAPTRVHVCIHQVSELVAGCGCVGTGSPQPMTIRPCPTGFQSHRGQCPTPAVANLTMPAGPAVAAAAPAVAAAPGVAVDHSQTWPGRSMLVTLSGFDDCAAAGASGYLRWDDTTVAGPFSMQNQPVQFTIEIPNNAASGSHLLSATCPGELITHGYGASTSIEVVPRPRSKFVVLPGSFSPGSRVDVEGAELPAECANGRFTVRLGERDLPVDISARSLEPYGSTGMDVTAFQGTFVAPADLQSGRRTATLICPDVGKVKATAVTVRTAPIRPAPSGRTPPDPDMSTPEQTSADLGWEPGPRWEPPPGNEGSFIGPLVGGVTIPLFAGLVLLLYLRSRNKRARLQPAATGFRPMVGPTITPTVRPVPPVSPLKARPAQGRGPHPARVSVVPRVGTVDGPVVRPSAVPSGHTISVRAHRDPGTHTTEGVSP